MKKKSTALKKSRHVKKEIPINYGTTTIVNCPFCFSHEIEVRKSFDDNDNYRAEKQQYCRNIRKFFFLPDEVKNKKKEVNNHNQKETAL